MKNLLIAALLLCTFQTTNACQFVPMADNFLLVFKKIRTSAWGTSYPYTLAIGNVTVNYYEGYGARFKSAQVLYGLPLADTVTVWGDPGWMCRSTIRGIPFSDTIIIFMEPARTNPNPLEKAGDYEIDPSLWGFMRLRNDSVFYGGYACCDLKMPLSDFIDSVNAIALLTPSSGIETYSESNSIRLSPNPALNEIQLQFGQQRNGQYQIHITGTTGQMMKQQSFYNTGKGAMPMDVSELPAGLYFCTVRGEDGYRQVIKFTKR